MKYTKVLLIVGVSVTLLGFVLLFAVKRYYETHSFMLPEPWWVADGFKMAYRVVFLVGFLTLVAGVVSWAVNIIKRLLSKRHA